MSGSDPAYGGPPEEPLDIPRLVAEGSRRFERRVLGWVGVAVVATFVLAGTSMVVADARTDEGETPVVVVTETASPTTTAQTSTPTPTTATPLPTVPSPTPTPTEATPTPTESPTPTDEPTADAAPGAPRRLAARADGFSVRLGWLESPGDVEAYEVFRDGQSFITVGANETSYAYTEDSTIEPGDHSFYVVATGPGGTSEPSNTVTVFVPNDVTR